MKEQEIRAILANVCSELDARAARRARQAGSKVIGPAVLGVVLAHEYGHTIQERIGALDRPLATVVTEQQADCFAGIWGHHANRSRQLLEQGDIEEGLNAASAIGDDRLQRQARGYVSPDSFTHGSSAQRVRWFRTGLEHGRLSACNTFAALR